MDTTFAVDADPLADPRVFQAVQDYQAELDAGRRPDRAAFAARYPEVAEAVAGCLSGLDFLLAATPRAATALSTDRADTRLGDFRILREVGRGGMGVVYEAEQISLGRRVAVKVLSAVAPDDRARQRFRNEAHAAASLTHPHIVPVYAVGDDGDTLFLAMRFVRGRSLAAHVRDWQEASATATKVPTATADDTATARTVPEVAEPLEALPFPPPPAADYDRAVARLVAAADALQHAHECGIVHRDIKPGNLMLEPDGHLWVTDFGLARLPGAADLTRTGEMLGTPRYMSPEQVAGGVGVDHRTDIYSLGATLYELLALRPAFPGTDAHDLLRRVVSEEPPALRAVARTVPADLETITLKAMAKEPAERYATARQLTDDLGRFLEDRPVLARRPSAAHRLRKWGKRNRVLLGAGVGVAFVFLCLAVVGLSISADRIDAERGQTAQANAELSQANTDLTAALRQARQAEYTHTFLTARREWLAGNFTRAAQFLDACPVECRDWEWGYQRQLCQPGITSVRTTYPASQLVFSPDGFQLAVVGGSGMNTGESVLEVWKQSDNGSLAGEPSLTLRLPGVLSVGCRFSPDSTRLLAVVAENSLNWRSRLQSWDARTGVPEASVALPGRPVALSPDGRRAVCQVGVTHQVVDTATGVVAYPLLSSAHYSPSGRQLVAVTKGKGVELLAPADGRRTLGRQDSTVRGPVALSSDDKWLAAHCDGPAVKLWDLSGEAEPRVLRGLTDPVTTLAFSPDGRRLATAGSDHFVHIWDVRTGQLQRSYRGYGADRLAFHPDGVRLVSRITGPGVAVWDLTTGQEGLTLPGGSKVTGRTAVTGDGARVIRAGMVFTGPESVAGVLEVVDVLSGRLLREVRDAATTTYFPIAGCADPARPDGLLLARLAAGWVVRDAGTGMELFALPGPPPVAYEVAVLSPDGGTLALAVRDKPEVRLVDGRTGRPRPALAARGTTECLTFHPHRQVLASAGSDGVRVWDLRTGECSAHLTGPPGPVHAIAFDPAGNRLASGGRDGIIRVWDVATGTILETITARNHVQAVAFSSARRPKGLRSGIRTLGRSTS